MTNNNSEQNRRVFRISGTITLTEEGEQIIENFAPRNTQKPTLSILNNLLVASQGSWESRPQIESYQFKFYKNGDVIKEGNEDTAELAGNGIYKVEVTAVNSVGFGSAFSEPVLYQLLQPINVTPPEFDGDLKVGNSVSFIPGVWQNASTIERWISEENNINTVIYDGDWPWVPTESLFGKNLIVVEKSGNVIARSNSKRVSGIEPDFNISNLNSVNFGETLSVNVTNITGVPQPTISYQWFFNDSPINGQNNNSLLITEDYINQNIKVKVTATNEEGVKEKFSNTIVPLNPAQASVNDINFDVVQNNRSLFFVNVIRGPVWVVLSTSNTEVGNRIKVENSGNVALTPNSTGQHKVLIFDSPRGGNIVFESRTFNVLPEQRSLSLNTPVSPQNVNVPLVINGTYSGFSNPTIIVSWIRNNNVVGQPFTINNSSNGIWSGTINTPSEEGVYKLRCSINNIITESNDINIVNQNVRTIATFVVEGTGLPENTIGLYGHAFPRGALPQNSSVVFRLEDSNVLCRTQVNPLLRWNDNSIKTALIAIELPSIENERTIRGNFVVGIQHPNPGSNLDLRQLLSNRSAVIKTWAPGNNNQPLWTFDVIQAALNSTDRWHSGPLAVSTRVETRVPGTAVLNTSNELDRIETVRLIVDVIATKDGFLELDVCFSNDRVHHSKFGIARFGYTIEIDNQIVYDQRPSLGPATDLLRYSQWIRRRGRKLDGTLLTGWGNSNRPFLRPDLDVLVASGVTLNFDRTFPITNGNDWARGILENAANRQNDPYWNYTLARDAGTAGGRPEIGYRTTPCAFWLRDGNRNCQILAQREFEAASTRAMYYYDWDTNRWINPLDWPKLSIWGPPSPVGTPKNEATGVPSGDNPTHNNRDHITIDKAHHGSFNFTPALLSGRRLCYDALAARSSWAIMENNDRHDGNLPWQYSRRDGVWRSYRPDHTTGISWAGKIWAPQTRSFAWDFRDMVDAVSILPENYPSRHIYEKNLEATINSFFDIKDEIYSRIGKDLGIPILHATGNHMPGFMFSFLFYGAISALIQGIGGPNIRWFVEEIAKFRLGSILHPDSSFRNAAMGRDIFVRSSNGTWARTWADVTNFTNQAIGLPNEDYTVNTAEGDWQRNVISGLGLLAIHGPTEEIKARAMDALVFLRSERARGVGNHPRYRQEDFFGGFWQLNSVFPVELSLRYDRNPVILPDQTFSVDIDSEEGTLVGIVKVNGPFPRNSSSFPSTPDSFVVVSQPQGNPFSISQGGAIRVANKSALASLPLGRHEITLYCRTWNQWRVDSPNIEQRSATVTININVTARNPFISEVNTPFAVAINSPVNGVVGKLELSGSRPYSLSILEPRYRNLFRVENNGIIRIISPLNNEEVGLKTMTVRLTNPAGSFDRVVRLDFRNQLSRPVIAQNQTLSIEDLSEIGTFVTPNISIDGSDPTILEILSGNTNNAFETVLPNRLRTRTNIVRSENPNYTLRVRAENCMGFSEENINVNVSFLSWIWGAFDVNILGAYDISTRLRPTYRGPLFRAKRVSDGVEMDFGLDRNQVDPSEVRNFANGSLVELITLYDQSTRNNHLSMPSVRGYPLLTDNSGNPYTMNNLLSFRTENSRGLKTDRFVTDLSTDLFAFTVIRPTQFSGDLNRLVSISENEAPNDAVGHNSLRLGIRQNECSVARGWTDNIRYQAIPTTANTLIGGISSRDQNWTLTLLLNNITTNRALNVSTPVNRLLHLRIGYHRDNSPTDSFFIGSFGTILIGSFIEKSTALSGIRTWLMNRFNIS
ncbi:MAG: hypothetical protein NZZ41_04160 [Candidatus Dojkabacteria bacterium]|nr:hypothetical protein [Candidatus Dojkabacteria bacterium]